MGTMLHFQLKQMMRIINCFDKLTELQSLDNVDACEKLGSPVYNCGCNYLDEYSYYNLGVRTVNKAVLSKS